jgi:acetyl-CoA carboxylase biotin carboxyl carrier protein
VSQSAGDPLLGCAGLTADQLSDLLGLVAGSDVVELDVSFGGARLSLRRPLAAAADARAVASSEDQREPRSLAIASPLVGVFRPSVATGDMLEAGQSIGAIEALGMPTSVDAPQSGTIEDLLVQDGSAVEYGQPLLIMRRANAP